MKKILGISAFYHDAAAALICGDEIIAAAQEERFTREKHTSEFPVHAIKYCLEEAGLEIDELDAIVFYDKPLLKFERLLQTYYSFAPRGIISFLKAIPIWLHEKLFLKKMIYDGLKEVEKYDKKKMLLLFTEHHLSHASSTFFASTFTKSAILTIDGVGEWCTASISLGEENNITFLKEMKFPHSVGLLYSAFTYFLGFKVNSGEYKLMGLAPYGNLESSETKKFINSIKENIVAIKEDGSIWLNQGYFDYATGLKMIKEKKWDRLFGFSRRNPQDELLQHHCNLSLAIQTITEEIVLKMVYEAKKITGAENLCMAGGVALNCIINGKLMNKNIFKNIFIQPASGDAGGAIGAAFAINYLYFKEKRDVSLKDKMKGTYLGPYYSNKEIELMNRKVKAVFKKHESFDELTVFTAKLIETGNVVGWFQGRMEFGPRALGNRSILANPTIQEMQKKINNKIKYRETFRPFAPSVLEEDVSNYFKIKTSTPFMLLVGYLNNELRYQLPSNYNELSLMEKLYVKRSKFQCVTHLDFSARIQTVHKESNPKYWKLLQAVKKQAGHGMVVNTSFNVRGEPIVCSPYDAYRCFMSTEMDYLVIENFVYCKTEQNDWQNRKEWVIKFKED